MWFNALRCDTIAFADRAVRGWRWVCATGAVVIAAAATANMFLLSLVLLEEADACNELDLFVIVVEVACADVKEREGAALALVADAFA